MEKECMKKKLIGFSETLEGRIEEYAKAKETNFTDAVRELILLGLESLNTDNVQGEDETPSRLDYISNQVEETIEQVKKLTEESAWFRADDTQSRLGNAEIDIKSTLEKIETMEKKLNVVVASSKFFKKHIDNRGIHLQD
jgi:hypothetical protein